MCYSVYLSTDSSEDLGPRSSDFVRFESVAADDSSPHVSLLEHPNRWFVGSKSGCSCTFRHLFSVELGFGDPEDWYPEEEDEIAATCELYDVLINLLSLGHRVDLVDAWEGTPVADIRVSDVSLDKVSRTAFRLFENYRFRLQSGTTRP